MQRKIPISATVITLNEEKNIERCLQSLQFADEIIVVDSGSHDNTIEKAEKWGARVFKQPWLGYGEQKNFAMQQAKHEWVLNIDADEEITDALRREIELLIPATTAHGFEIARKTFYNDQWIRFGGWYPNYVMRLCRKGNAQWTTPKLHEKLSVQGKTERLRSPMHHFTFGSIEDQVRTNLRYAKEGAAQLRRAHALQFKIKIIYKPFVKFLESYIFKLGFLDGWLGWIIAINSAHSMFLKYAFLMENRDNAKKCPSH